MILAAIWILSAILFFYAMLPFAFMVFAPENALAAGFLMLSFVGTGSSFLAYAILEAKTPEILKEKINAPAAEKKVSFIWAA